MDYVGNVTLSGHYKIDGRILILPISGEGKYTNLISMQIFNGNNVRI